MRIALVHPYRWPAVRRGAERYLDDLAWYLAGRGHAVDVVTGTEGRRRRERIDGVVVHEVRHRAGARLAARAVGPVETFGAVALGPLLRRRYDVVHALTPTAAIAARLAGQRVVYTLLGHPVADAVPSASARRLLVAAIRAAHAPVALSRASATAAHLLAGRPVGVLAPGVRTERFPPRLEPRTGGPRLLLSADLSLRQKGVDVAARALAAVLDARPDARLVLSGTGSPAWVFDDLGADRRRVGEAIDVVGPGAPDDVPGRYREATATLLPSRHEAFGLALVESLASGTPVVAGDDGGPPEIVDDRAVGRIVPTGDAVALAASILDVIDLAGRAETPGRCADHARRWDWTERAGPAHERLYERVAR